LVAAAKFLVAATKTLFVVANFVAVTKTILFCEAPIVSVVQDHEKYDLDRRSDKWIKNDLQITIRSQGEKKV